MACVEILQQKGYNFLWVDGHLWMWDVPDEVADQKEIAQQAYGDVLVAGYGLGLVQRFLLENQRVASVLTAEICAEVIAACEKIYGRIYGDVVIADFYSYEPSRQYDCIIGDIWPDQALRHIAHYLKFKERAKPMLTEGGRLLGWGADYFEYLLQMPQAMR